MLNVVTGPPCAGKSTYVRERRSPGSVVVDFDALAVALGSDTSHMCEGDIRKAAFEARGAVIRAAHRYGEVWVIHTSLNAHAMREYQGATFHDLNPGIDECIRRAREDGRPSGTIEQISAWYANNGDVRANARGNVRTRNGAARRKARARLRAEGRPCWICEAFGRPASIDYSLPSGHPFSFEVDELVPVSLGGSPIDYANLAAAHRRCNQWRGNKTVAEVVAIARGERQGPAGEAGEARAFEGTNSIEW